MGESKAKLRLKCFWIYTQMANIKEPPGPSFTKVYYPLSRLLSATKTMLSDSLRWFFTAVIGRLSSLEALLSQELDRSQVSAQWNTFVVATKGLLISTFNSILSSIFSRPL